MATPDAPESWTHRLVDQLEFHWGYHVRPRLEGLTDDEYFWEPVPDCWSVRPRAEAKTELVGGSGAYVIEAGFPEPDPAPVTTIAWRMAHLTVTCFGMRNEHHFDGPPMGFMEHEYPATAEDGLSDLDDAYRRWVDGAAALSAEAIEEPVGPAEGPFAEHPYASLILHINREAIHHSAEILLLRDLYARRVP